MQKTVIIIAGPTAVGKTALAIELALYYNTVIISADSRQCYKELGIGVAKPSEAELQAVKHYFINSHSIEDSLSAADFENYALSQLQQLFLTKEVVVMVGGTGLYMKAFVEGLDQIPPVSDAVKEKLSTAFEKGGMPWLQAQVREEDPAFFETGEILNPQRLLRALEVKWTTGKSIQAFRTHQKKERPFRIIQFGLELPRAVLYKQINQRVLQMVADGLVEEARKLIPFRSLNALQTVGYRELFDCFDGITSLDRAIELIQQNTRHYAKRQMTWFKKDPNMQWVDVGKREKALQQIIQQVIPM
jgi:tRNA dimethylallyltransferase